MDYKDYKEKYDKALEVAKRLLCFDKAGLEDYFTPNDLYEIFPELKESEDESIRKELIEHIKANKEVDFVLFKKFSSDEVLAWLEKQGEKKYSWDENEKAHLEFTQAAIEYCYDENNPLRKELVAWLNSLKEKVQPKQGKSALEATNEEMADNANKVEPKFEVGCWIVTSDDEGVVTTEMITKFLGNKVELIDTKGIRVTFPQYELNHYHLWTIKDAKKGDVLYSIDSKQPFIYKERPQFSQANGYCCINIFGEFAIWNTSKCVICADKYIPATKEQRALLFTKMHEAGYEWDEEKKELKKIEDEPENYKKQLMSEMTNLVIDYIQQKPKGITAWIARDKSGEVLLYEEKPVKLKNDPIWESPEGGSLGIKELPEGINPKWEDEEAAEVELIIKKKTND